MTPGDALLAFLAAAPSTDLPEVVTRLRLLTTNLNGAKPLDVQAVRTEVTRVLTEHGVPDARRLVDAAFAERAEAHAPATVQGQAVALDDPEPWPEAVDGADLLADLVQVFPRHLALVDGAATAFALWTLHAHAHDAAAISPILALTSPEKRSGKTTTLSLLGALLPRALTASSISPAAVFRTVERYHPSLLVDEADTVFQLNEELRALYNAAHSRPAAYTVRVVGEQLEPRLFSTWCPKVIALIGTLPDTIEDRTILVPMRRRRPDEHVARLRLDRLGELAPLRRRAWRWAQDHLEALRVADPVMPETLHDRARDNWRPLVAVADAIGGSWPERARLAALLLSGGVQEGEQAPAVQLLADLWDLFAERRVERLASADIVASLTQREDRPWPEWKQGRPLTVRQLARLLARFDIRPRKIRQGDTTLQGYERDAFDDAFARYLPPSPPSDPEQPEQSSNGAEKPASSDPEQGGRVPDAKSRENPRGASSVPDVPDQKGGEAPPGAGDAREPEG